MSDATALNELLGILDDAELVKAIKYKSLGPRSHLSNKHTQTARGKPMKQLGYMAIDQYGEALHLDGEHPRKALLKKLGASSASKMYVDKKDNPSVFRHAGYIVGGRWFTLYRVCAFSEFKKL